MLSYRHGFHAGNHADVLKHMTLCLIMRALTQKDKPATFIDTHSGAGLYDLTSGFASKNLEYNTGWDLIKDNAKLQELIPEYYKVCVLNMRAYCRSLSIKLTSVWSCALAVIPLTPCCHH